MVGSHLEVYTVWCARVAHSVYSQYARVEVRGGKREAAMWGYEKRGEGAPVVPVAMAKCVAVW